MEAVHDKANKLQLYEDAAVVLQQMLSRKKMLASRSGSFTSMQPPSAGAMANEDASGCLERGVAVMLRGVQPGGLEAQLDPGVLQRFLAEQEPVPASAASSAIAGSDGGNSLLVHSNQQQQQQQPRRQQQVGAMPAAASIAATVSSASRMWEISAAEQALEQELRELGVLGEKLHTAPAAEPATAAAAAAAAAVNLPGAWGKKRSSSGSAAGPADPYSGTEPDSRFSSCTGLATPAAAGTGAAVSPSAGAADATATAAAEALDAALQDPNASVEDIVGILNYVLDLSTGGSPSMPAGTSAGGNSAVKSSTESPKTQNPGGATAAAAAVAAAAAFTRGAGSKVARSSSNASETSSEMAARLLEQARAMHANTASAEVLQQPQAAAGTGAGASRSSQGSRLASAEAGVPPSGNARPQPVSDAGASAAQQAAAESIQAWNAGGGLLLNNTPAPGAASSTGSAVLAAPRSRGGSPAARQLGQNSLTGGMLSPGGYASRSAERCARRSMSPHNAMKQQEQQQQHEPWVTPAEIENAWRQALRSSTAHPSARGQQQQQQQLAAAALDGLYGALGPQEWLGYEGLLGLQQQQQCAGNSCSDGGGKPLPWPYDGKDVNAYKAKVTPELDAKLQRLYQRNVDWRRRCEMVYTRQRYSEMKEELQGCTFHPVINKKSEKLVQNNMRYPARPIRPVTPLADWPPQQQKPQQRQRPASTGRMGLRRSPAQQQQQPQQQEVQKQHAAACSAAAAAAAALLGEDAGRELLDRMLAISSMVPAQTPGQHSHNDGFSFSPSSGANASDGSSRKRSTVPPAVPAAAQGLYDAAAVKRERQVLVQEVTKETERKARSWSAPRCAAYRDVAPRVYDHLLEDSSSPRNVPHLQTGLEECTFHPQTNVASSKFPARSRSASPPPARPKQGAAAAGSATARDLAEEFQLAMQQQPAGPGPQQDQSPDFCALLQSRLQQSSTACAEGATAAAAAAAACGSLDEQLLLQQQQQQRQADADWAEFIERQGTFLLIKEAKKAQLAADMGRSKKPELSPGSKRIIKEKQRLQQMNIPGRDSVFEQQQQQQRQEQQEQQAQQHYHITAQVLPSSLYCDWPCRAGSCPAAEGSIDVNNSPGGSSSAGSPYLSRMQQKLHCSSPHSTSPAGSTGSPSSSYGHSYGCPGQLQASKGSSSSYSAGRSKSPGGSDPNFSFKPAITRKAASMKARSVEEMSEGDRLRREAKLEQLRIMAEARRLAGVTFSPDMSPTRSRGPSVHYELVKSKLSLKPDGLEAYMDSLHRKRREREEKRRQVEQQRQEAELAECTFRPVTTPVPAYLSAMADVGYTARFIEARMTGAMAPAQHITPAHHTAETGHPAAPQEHCKEHYQHCRHAKQA